MIRNNDSGQGVVEIFPRSTAYAHTIPDHILSLYHFANGKIGNGVYPILSASTPTTAIWLPGIRSVLLKEIDADTKKTVTKAETAETVSIGQAGPSAVEGKGNDKSYPEPSKDPNDTTGHHVMPGDPADKKMAESLKSVFEQFKVMGMAIKLEVETIGIPTIQPGDVVVIQGLGMRLDRDNYCVHDVTHTINTSGFMTKLVMFSGTNPILNQTIQSMTAAGVDKNTEQPQPDANTTTAQPKSG